jgi:predicted Co/Zn/Cd cation transporter (cation efflux family)
MPEIGRAQIVAQKQGCFFFVSPFLSSIVAKSGIVWGILVGSNSFFV